jgi:short subunit dehydrogenase-like uncharacterized protein
MANTKRIMLYGATGFTAGLMIDALKSLPCELILAGRNANTVETLARKHTTTHTAFALDNLETTQRHLRGIDLVINCAGPFAQTALAIVNAALLTRTSYFDITGELSIFMRIHHHHDAAIAKGITLIPGLGFDIAPSDCLAALLARRVKNPSSLTLAIATKNTRVSHGTLKTVVLESKNQVIARREDGIKNYDDLSLSRDIVINGKPRHCMRAPLGDLFCAHLSTGISNIDTFVAIPKNLAKFSRLLPLLSKLGQNNFAHMLIERAIESLPNGPTLEQQQQGSAYIYGEVVGANGMTEKAVMKTKEPYVYTADLMVAGVRSWLDKGLHYGFLTPSQAFGAQFAEATCPGEVHVEFLSASHQHELRNHPL